MKVLFICNGNVARSQMAVEVMSGIGHSLADNVRKVVTEELVNEADLR